MVKIDTFGSVRYSFLIVRFHSCETKVAHLCFILDTDLSTTTTMSVSTTDSTQTTTTASTTSTTTAFSGCSGGRLTSSAVWSSVDVTVAGGQGAGSNLSQLSGPQDLTLNSSTQQLFVSDSGNGRVIQLTWGNGTTGTVVASGSGLAQPAGIVVDDTGAIYVNDHTRYCVIKFVSGTGTSVAGTCGSNGIALNQLYEPTGLTLDNNVNFYVTDAQNSRVMKFISSSGTPNGTVVAGNNGTSNGLNHV
jgi:sugar lactone lactonase YvrE